MIIERSTREDKNSKKWWICDASYCQQKLAEVIREDGDYLIVEFNVIEGQKIRSSSNHLLAYCKKCGTKNTLFAGKLGSKRWIENLKQVNQFDPQGYWKDFIFNAHRRNALLKELSHQQKRIFEAITKQVFEKPSAKIVGSWKIEDSIPKLNISEKQIADNLGLPIKVVREEIDDIYQIMDSVSSRLWHKKTEKMELMPEERVEAGL